MCREPRDPGTALGLTSVMMDDRSVHEWEWKALSPVSGEAEKAGMKMLPAKLLIFGSPIAGTDTSLRLVLVTSGIVQGVQGI